MIFTARARTVSEIDNFRFAGVDREIVKLTVEGKTVKQNLELLTVGGNKRGIVSKLEHSQNTPTNNGSQ
jgi:hypothetical protein